MQTKDIVKILYCLTYCELKQNCEVFSPCVGSKSCLIPALNECEQLDKCRRIKRIVKAILRCKTLAEIYNTKGGDSE